MFKLVVRVALVASVLTPLAAVAQELIPSAPQRAQTSETAGRQNAPGQFDFYVLALSWSPSFCAAATERPSARGPGAECSARPYAFVVHGLWPQYDAGFPEYCQMPSPRLDRGIVSSMLDLMPAPHLIFSEWDRHGTCSGLAPHAYFEAVRRARGDKNPVGLCRPRRPAQHRTCGGGRRLHQSQPRPRVKRHRHRLQRHAAHRGQAVSGQGFVQGGGVSRLRRDRQAQLPARSGGDAAGARQRLNGASRPRFFG